MKCVCMCVVFVFVCVCFVVKVFQNLHSAVEIIACFEALCGVKTAASLTQIIPGICTPDEAEHVDSNCNWSKAKKLGSVSGGAEVIT